MYELKAFYDNGGKTVNRYTVVVETGMSMIGPDGPTFDICLSLSDKPDSPQGDPQWSPCVVGNHLGEKVNFKDLPKNIQRRISLHMLGLLGFGDLPKKVRKRKERDFSVTVCRTAYGYRTIKVRARSEKEACDKAIDMAGTYEFSAHHADYIVEDVEEK